MKKKKVEQSEMFESPVIPSTENMNGIFNGSVESDCEPPFEMQSGPEDSPSLGEIAFGPHTPYPTFEEIVSNELTKFDAVIPKVAELSAEFMPLKIQSIEDKDGYNEVSKALRFIVSKRTAVEEKRKELKADSLAFGRAVDARAKEITAMLSPIEDHLKTEKQRIDDEIENLKRLEQEAKDKLINDRILKLVSLGFTQTVSEFIWFSKLDSNYTQTFLRVNLELWSDEDFNDFTNRVSEINEAEDASIKRQDAERKAEDERIKLERQKLEEEQNKLKAETDKLRAEMAKIRNERTQYRNSILTNLGLGGLSFNNYWLYFKRKNAFMPVQIISRDEVDSLDNDQWENRLREIISQIEELKRQDAIDEEADNLRFKALAEEEAKKESQRLFAEAETKKKEQEAAEKERISNLSDKEKFEVYVSSLLDIEVPDMNTKKWQGYASGLIKTITSFKNMS